MFVPELIIGNGWVFGVYRQIDKPHGLSYWSNV